MMCSNIGRSENAIVMGDNGMQFFINFTVDYLFHNLAEKVGIYPKPSAKVGQSFSANQTCFVLGGFFGRGLFNGDLFWIEDPRGMVPGRELQAALFLCLQLLEEFLLTNTFELGFREGN